MGVTPVRAAAPAAVVAAISAPMPDSVTDDKSTAAGITPNPLVILPPKGVHKYIYPRTKLFEFKMLALRCRPRLADATSDAVWLLLIWASYENPLDLSLGRHQQPAPRCQLLSARPAEHLHTRWIVIHEQGWRARPGQLLNKRVHHHLRSPVTGQPRGDDMQADVTAALDQPPQRGGRRRAYRLIVRSKFVFVIDQKKVVRAVPRFEVQQFFLRETRRWKTVLQQAC